MKTNSLTLGLLALNSSFCFAQMQSISAANTTVGSTGIVQFNNFAELGQKSNTKIEYSDVQGNCFWQKEWYPAMLVLKSGTFKLKQVKLNFYTNDVHYLDASGRELIAQSKINKVVFLEPKDSLKTAAVFVHERGYQVKQSDFFAQLLCDGKIQLLKSVEMEIKKRDNGPLMNTNADLRFSSQEHYYLNKAATLLPLRKINKKNLSTLIEITPDDESWLVKNENKLKNEGDAIAFFEYYNHKEEKK
jgi:hypothetical protein